MARETGLNGRSGDPYGVVSPSGYAGLQASRDVSRRKRDLAKSIDGRTRDGYAHGLGTSLDLVISAEALRQADIDLALLEFQVGSARAHAVLADAECVY